MTGNCGTEMRVIFLAESLHESWRARDVTVPTGTEVRWSTLEDMENMKSRQLRFRGDEPLIWASYVQEGESPLLVCMVVLQASAANCINSYDNNLTSSKH